MTREELAAINTWAEGHYPGGNGAPPDLRTLTAAELTGIFQQVKTFQAHLALVDQPAVRSLLERRDPTLIEAVTQTWNRTRAQWRAEHNAGDPG